MTILKSLRFLPEFPVVAPNPTLTYDKMRKTVNDFYDFYVNELFAQRQTRQKWQKRTPNLKPGDLVLIRNYYVEQKCLWPRTIIVSAHLDAEGVARFYTYKTATNKIDKIHT